MRRSLRFNTCQAREQPLSGSDLFARHLRERCRYYTHSAPVIDARLRAPCRPRCRAGQRDSSVASGDLRQHSANHRSPRGTRAAPTAQSLIAASIQNTICAPSPRKLPQQGVALLPTPCTRSCPCRLETPIPLVDCNRERDRTASSCFHRTAASKADHWRVTPQPNTPRTPESPPNCRRKSR